MYPEQRLFPRTAVYWPVRVQRPGTPTPIQTLTKDLSLGGLRALSPDVVPVATSVEIEISLAKGQEPMRVQGRTMWFRMLPKSDQLEVGFSFQGLTPMNKRRLSVCLEQLQSKSLEASKSAFRSLL